jgi:S-DNA-T family DNA segregation ATPase FtsK/SpoIIIE
MGTKFKDENIRSKSDLFELEKEKIYLDKKDKENLAYAEKRHNHNAAAFNTLLHIIKLPYYLGYKLPRFIISKITFKSTKEQQQREINRLKRVMEAKERALNSNILKELAFIEAFKTIGFKDSIGKYPELKSIEVIDKLEKLIFKSNINISAWKSSIEKIETAINTNIIDIRQDKTDKQIVILDTTKENIPELLTWDNELLLDGLLFNLGRTALNQIIVDMEHYTSGIIGGSVGSGKSVTLQGIIIQLILKNALKKCKNEIILFDGKDMGDYKRLKKYLSYTADIDEFREQLESITREYDRRKKLFDSVDVEKIAEYNKKQKTFKSKIPEIFILIDEISIITDKSGLDKDSKLIAEKMTRILADMARLGRAAGIHVIIGIQVPNMQTVPGQLKNVIDMRVSGFLKDESASNIVLNNNLASRLPHVKGRMIFDITEYQSYFFDKNIDYFAGLDITEIERRKVIKDDSKTIDLSKKRKETVKRDSNGTIEADIDLTNE